MENTEKKQEKVVFRHGDITEKILSAFFAVYRNLGIGFLEKVYENALMVELQQCGLAVIQQAPIRVSYRGKDVGEYYADLLVENTVIIEIKVAKEIGHEHEAQLINYLRATPYEVGLILNFGPKAEFRRKIFDNTRKTCQQM